MRVLLLSRYGRLGASSRYRSYQFLPYLAEKGIAVEVLPLLDDEYLSRLYTGRAVRPGRVLRSYLRRIKRLSRRSGHELVWLEYEAFPWLPGAVEKFFLGARIPYIVDYDDAVFHRYDLHASAVVRGVLGTKIDRVMKRAAGVIAGNAYIADRARAAGAGSIHILPTVVDPERFQASRRPVREPFTIGWIGTPVTTHYLTMVRGPLESLARRHPVRCVVIGAGPLDMGSLHVEHRPWSEATESDAMSDVDVGIMPLPDTPWERGKCGHKLIKYMAAGLPVVASPVGANRDIVREGVNGFLPVSGEDWLNALDRLRADPALRASFGRAGRALVEEEYSLHIAAPRLLEFLYLAAGIS